MKKLSGILIALMLLTALTGCSTATDSIAEDVTEGVVIKSFIGTVVEENKKGMRVEIDEGEEERSVSDTIGILYTTIHADYLYGTGRRVVVYYQSDSINEKGEIITDDISTEGFRDFELVATENGETRFERVNAADEEKQAEFNNINVKTYGVEVMVNVDGKTVLLNEALEKGYITPQAITARANHDAQLKKAKEITYRDGGSREYVYDNYKIIKYHTEDGKRDLYIGSLNMKYTK